MKFSLTVLASVRRATEPPSGRTSGRKQYRELLSFQHGVTRSALAAKRWALARPMEGQCYSLFAGACAMALGEWLSVTNAREMASSQLDKEAEELRATPERAHAELALVFEARGMPEDEAKRAANRITANDPDAVEAMAREELRIRPADFGVSPSSAAAVAWTRP